MIDLKLLHYQNWVFVLIPFVTCLLQEATGVFLKNGVLHYPLYRNAFPLWALAEYRTKVLLPSTSP